VPTSKPLNNNCEVSDKYVFVPVETTSEEFPHERLGIGSPRSLLGNSSSLSGTINLPVLLNGGKDSPALSAGWNDPLLPTGEAGRLSDPPYCESCTIRHYDTIAPARGGGQRPLKSRALVQLRILKNAESRYVGKTVLKFRTRVLAIRPNTKKPSLIAAMGLPARSVSGDRFLRHLIALHRRSERIRTGHRD
jgi:hypothetical protein